MRSGRSAAAALALIVAVASTAPAAEWHEAYRDGVKALAQGQPARAVGLLEQAIAQRPEPGRNVITYGTNVVERYYPYLRLAEARLALHDPAGARSALERSEKWGREPGEERRALSAQADDLAARLAPKPSPAPVHTATPHPSVAAPSPPAEASPTPAPPTPVAATPAASAAPPRPPAGAAARALPPPPAAAAAERRAEPAVDPGARLEVVSQPPGAAVYVDDELVGTTDPEWGRLVKSGLAPGTHRVRLARAGYEDVTEELEVSAGQRVELRRRLVASAPASRRPTAPFLALAALLVLGALAWAFGRRRRHHPATGPTPVVSRTDASPGFDTAAPTPLRGTPPVPSPPGGVETFGEYRLLERLGRGGMATVHRAERRGEISALKRPLAEFLDEPTFRERFLREAEIGRTLHHPNIVRILDRGEVGPVPFFTMELVPGETLQAQLRHRGALLPRTAAGIVVQVAEALDYAHLKGVVHRDLKPSNVMVLEDGTAKVMDYGIARARRFEGLTVTGSFLGSPEYVAPEAIEGKSIDARSDLYSLGVIFYETLTGRRPFNADTPFGVLRKHLTETPAPPSQLRPEVPPELERIVLRLLDKHAEQRHAGAEELVLELRDFLNRAA